MRRLAPLAAFVVSWSRAVLAHHHPSASPAFGPNDIITRDVAIIGGGSSGTHAAISLKDKGKSVIVVEKKGRMGGHTETYTDPLTGIPVDYGVLVFHNNTLVKNYFNRFDVPLVDLISPNINTLDFNFRTGDLVNVTHPSPEAVGAAFAKYAAFIAKYPALDRGLFLPNPVPEDLLLPFGEAATIFGFEDAVQSMYTTNQGVGDILTLPTIENIRVNGLSLLQEGLLMTARYNNSELYGKAQAELLAANSLLLSSSVIHSTRSNTGVQLIVRTPHGKKLIRAKKLLLTIPPRVEFLEPFDIDTQEVGVFEKLIDAGYYAALVNNTGIPDNVTLWNYAPNTSYNLPILPGIHVILPTAVPGLRAMWYSSQRSNLTYPLSDTFVKSDIMAMIKTLQIANPDKFNITEPEFVVFSDHAPFYLQARPEDVRNGIYADMYALQGKRSTYWSGAAWRAHDSSMLWKFNEEVVLPMVLEGL